MEIVNAILRVSSGVIFFGFLHQLFFSRGGSRRHILFGIVSLCFGIAILVTVIIRGMHQETFSTLYILHLVVGVPFLVGIVLTALYGHKARRNKEFAIPHRMVARATGILLLLTILLGILSKIMK